MNCLRGVSPQNGALGVKPQERNKRRKSTIRIRKMEDTSCGDKCAFIKMGACSRCEECPNYMESWWTEHMGSPKLVKDCSPKRLLLQNQHLHLRLEQLQASCDVARTEYENVAGKFTQMLALTEKLLDQHAKSLILHDEPLQLTIKDEKETLRSP